MDQSNVTKIGKLIISSGESFFRETFNKISNKVESFKNLSETEQELITFGIEVFEYFEKTDKIPNELEEHFLSLKRRIDKLEKK